MQRRSKDLAAAQEHIIAELLKAHSEQQVNRILALWMPVSQDNSTTAGAELAKVADQRKKRIEFENKFSDGEIAMMKTELGIVDVPVKPELPTPEEIGLAMLREIASLGGTHVNRTTGHYVIPPADLLGCYYILELKRITVLESAPVGDGSYICKYSIKVNLSLPQKFLDDFGLSSSPIHMKLLNAQHDEMNSTTPILIDHFVLTPGGWRSPTYNQRGLEAMLDVQKMWAESIESAVRSLAGFED